MARTTEFQRCFLKKMWVRETSCGTLRITDIKGDSDGDKKRKKPEPEPLEDVRRDSDLEQSQEDTTSSSPETPAPKKRRISSPEEISKEDFEAKYQQLNPLGEGGYGSVYAGYRRADHFPVAIKHIPREKIIYEDNNQNSRRLPLEVAIMLKMAHAAEGAVGKFAAISLLDYYDLDQELVLVLERPVPCTDLFDYIIDKGSLEEEEARVILKQLVEAAIELQETNIFHRDIKLENILMETSARIPRVRLIDFGLSCFTKQTSMYRTFYGTSAHSPPEWYQSCTYQAGPTTVWQVGVALYEILHPNAHFETLAFLCEDLEFNQELSRDCKDMLGLCLAIDPQQRPSLQQLQLHPWIV